MPLQINKVTPKLNNLIQVFSIPAKKVRTLMIDNLGYRFVLEMKREYQRSGQQTSLAEYVNQVIPLMFPGHKVISKETQVEEINGIPISKIKKLQDAILNDINSRLKKYNSKITKERKLIQEALPDFDKEIEFMMGVFLTDPKSFEANIIKSFNKDAIEKLIDIFTVFAEEEHYKNSSVVFSTSISNAAYSVSYKYMFLSIVKLLKRALHYKQQ